MGSMLEELHILSPLEVVEARDGILLLSKAHFLWKLADNLSLLDWEDLELQDGLLPKLHVKKKLLIHAFLLRINYLTTKHTFNRYFRLLFL